MPPRDHVFRDQNGLPRLCMIESGWEHLIDWREWSIVGAPAQFSGKGLGGELVLRDRFVLTDVEAIIVGATGIRMEQAPGLLAMDLDVVVSEKVCARLSLPSLLTRPYALTRPIEIDACETTELRLSQPCDLDLVLRLMGWLKRVTR